MKSVGKLIEFIPGYNPQQLERNAQYFVYRQLSAQGNADFIQFTGLLLPASPESRSANGQTPSCLVYKADTALDILVNQLAEKQPDLTASSENNTVQHQLWCVNDQDMKVLLAARLDQLSEFYSLDSWVVPSHQHILTHTLLLADTQLQPQPCHRLLADLAGMDDYEFLQRLQKCFNIRVADGAGDATPGSAREFGLYVAGGWYHLRLIDGTWFHADPVSDLDVSVVHDNMIAPMLGITENNDSRIAFTGAGCSVQALQQLVDSGQWQAAWLMPAPTIEQLMQISDLGRSMPMNSVCFQPLFDPAVSAVLAR